MTRLALLLALCAGGCDRSSAKQPAPEPPVAIADPKQAAAAHAAGDWARCATLWLAVAGTTRGEAMAGPLYDAACCQARGGDRDAAFATLARAVAHGLTEPGIADDPDLASLHADPRWRALLAQVADARARAEAAVAEPALRQTLLALEREDQDARDGNDEQLVAAVDARTTGLMREIVARYGWPGKSLVGKDGAHAAWLLVQHSRDLGFQQQCLEKLELAVAQGEAQAVEHAYLYDRVAVNTGKPQRWGTQFDADHQPYPIEDAARVDERRKAIGLSSLAEYARLLRESYVRE